MGMVSGWGRSVISTVLPPVSGQLYSSLSPRSPKTCREPWVPLSSRKYPLPLVTNPVSETPMAPPSNSSTDTALSSTPRWVTWVNWDTTLLGSPKNQWSVYMGWAPKSIMAPPPVCTSS